MHFIIMRLLLMTTNIDIFRFFKEFLSNCYFIQIYYDNTVNINIHFIRSHITIYVNQHFQTQIKINVDYRLTIIDRTSL